MAGSYAAAGFLYHSSSGRVLLHLRDAAAPVNPDTWAFFGGAAEPEDGGDPRATWCRELREELGVVVDPGAVVPLGEDRVGVGERAYFFYSAWPAPDEDFRLREGAAFRWFALEEALALPNLARVARGPLERLRDRAAGLGAGPSG